MPEDVPPPVINTVNPFWGKAGDHPITITGNNLAPSLRTVFTVKTTAKDGPINSVTGNTQVTTTVPHGLPTGNGTVIVVSPGGPSNTLEFTVQPTEDAENQIS